MLWPGNAVLVSRQLVSQPGAHSTLTTHRTQLSNCVRARPPSRFRVVIALDTHPLPPILGIFLPPSPFSSSVPHSLFYIINMVSWLGNHPTTNAYGPWHWPSRGTADVDTDHKRLFLSTLLTTRASFTLLCTMHPWARLHQYRLHC